VPLGCANATQTVSGTQLGFCGWSGWVRVSVLWDVLTKAMSRPAAPFSSAEVEAAFGLLSLAPSDGDIDVDDADGADPPREAAVTDGDDVLAASLLAAGSVAVWGALGRGLAGVGGLVADAGDVERPPSMGEDDWEEGPRGGSGTAGTAGAGAASSLASVVEGPFVPDFHMPAAAPAPLPMHTVSAVGKALPAAAMKGALAVLCLQCPVMPLEETPAYLLAALGRVTGPVCPRLVVFPCDVWGSQPRAALRKAR
jgi:hypothetical protein